MSKSRIIEFDYIRVVCLAGILVCHSLLDRWESYEWLGRLLGMTFNFLFLILSAFLFGMSWEEKGYPAHGIRFLKRRVIKLSKSYYPYLVVLFLLLYFSQGYFSARKVVSHALYLPWFDKIDGFGHLWFLSMIVLCYIGCVLVSGKVLKKMNWQTWLVIAFVSIMFDYMISTKGLPGYIFPYLIGYTLVFRYSRHILEGVKCLGLAVNISQFCLISLANFLVFKVYNLDPYSFYSYLLGIVQAVSIFCLLYNLCVNLSASKVVMFISGISFEVYLVHEFFLGRYSVYKRIHEPAIAILSFALLSLLAGYLLNIVSQSLTRKSHSS